MIQQPQKFMDKPHNTMDTHPHKIFILLIVMIYQPHLMIHQPNRIMKKTGNTIDSLPHKIYIQLKLMMNYLTTQYHGQTSQVIFTPSQNRKKGVMDEGL